MKIKRKQLNKIIYNYLNEGISDNDMLNEFSLKGQLKDKLNLDLDSKEFDKNRKKFFTITDVVENKQIKPHIIEFLRLLGYVCYFSEDNQRTKNTIEELWIDMQKASNNSVKVTSAKRDGMSQIKSWCNKITSGEKRIDTIDLYSPGNKFNDPYMTQATKANATKAYDMLTKLIEDEGTTAANIKSDDSKLKPIAEFLDTNPVSAHQKGDSIDLRVVAGKGEKVLPSLKYIKDTSLANFHYQEEAVPPHIHIGPESSTQKTWLTTAGKAKLAEYDSIIDAMKYKVDLSILAQDPEQLRKKEEESIKNSDGATRAKFNVLDNL